MGARIDLQAALKKKKKKILREKKREKSPTCKTARTPLGTEFVYRLILLNVGRNSLLLGVPSWGAPAAWFSQEQD